MGFSLGLLGGEVDDVEWAIEMDDCALHER